jgi:hypothetical protein
VPNQQAVILKNLLGSVIARLTLGWVATQAFARWRTVLASLWPSVGHGPNTSALNPRAFRNVSLRESKPGAAAIGNDQGAPNLLGNTHLLISHEAD